MDAEGINKLGSSESRPRSKQSRFLLCAAVARLLGEQFLLSWKYATDQVEYATAGIANYTKWEERSGDRYETKSGV